MSAKYVTQLHFGDIKSNNQTKKIKPKAETKIELCKIHVHYIFDLIEYLPTLHALVLARHCKKK